MSTSCYTGQCVVVFGAASLQRYIFQSNRLKENIGASYLVEHWLGNGLVEATGADRTKWDKYAEEDPRRAPLKNPVVKDKAINVIYVGGGNAALLCEDRNTAEQAVRTWSRKVLENASGLRVVVGYGEVNKGRSLAGAYQDALENLSSCEEALPFGAALHGLPVVRRCISTGLPASESRRGDNNQDEWISQAAACKRDRVDPRRSRRSAQDHIASKFPQVLEKTEALPRLSRFAIHLDEELGGRKGESHIAVVHADGNGMGNLLNQVIDAGNQEDDVFLHDLRAFSASTTQLSHRALNQTLLHLKGFLRLEALDHAKEVFPVRPIVYSGDDLTFVCDGRVGLHLAAFYLKEFSSGEVRVCGTDESVDACAGVAIVPTKFPFARAYAFADELCGLAKSHRRYKANPKGKGSWLDFQIIQEGATRSIQALREAQYRSLEKGRQRLDQRPYNVLEASTNGLQVWNRFADILSKFQSNQWPRSRAKGLFQALVQGPTATKAFIDNERWNDRKLPPPESETGWTSTDDADRTTPYFDPLEVLDFYLPELLLNTMSDAEWGDEE